MFKNRFTQTPHIRLFDKIILVITCLCTVAICCFSFISHKKNQESQEKALIKNLQQYTKQSQITIENNFEKNFEMLEYIRSFPEVYNMNWEEQYEFLNGQEVHLDFEHLFVMDLQGNGYYVQDNVIRNQSGEEFYENVMTNNRFITDPFLEYNQNRSITTLSVPIFKNNIKVGALCGVINLQSVYDMFDKLKIGAEGYNFIINSNGDFVAHTDMRMVHDKKNLFNNLDGNEKNNEFFEKSIVNKVPVVEELKIEGEKSYVSFTPLKTTNWSIVFVVSKNEVLATSNSYANFQRNTLVFGIGLLLLSIGLLFRGFENHKLAYTDSLTKINNRAAANIIMKDLNSNTKVDVSIVCIDLDDFKFINDTYGHQQGDILLCTMGKLLKEVFHKYAFVARMGGDEFSIILVNKSYSEIEVKINQLKILIDEYNKFSEHKILISYGQASRKAGQDTSLDGLYKEADENMYKDKSAHKAKKVNS